MSDPSPSGQTWRCGRTDPHTPHASYADHEKVCPGIPRPVPPAPSQRDPELAAALNEQRRQSYNAETLRTRPAPRSDTPSDERHPGYPHQPGEPLTLDLTVDLARPAPSPVPEASGRPGEMVFTQGSPRPALQVLVSLTDGRPCVDAVSMLAFFRDSAAWNEVAGDPEKVAGLRAAADAMWELHGKAKAHLHDPAPSSSPVPEASGEDEVQPTMHILRRADGEEMGEFAFWATDGPDGWDMAEDNDHDEDTVYEILACYPVARRKILWSTLCETCDGEGDGCPACAGSGECEPPDAEHMPIIARPAPSSSPVGDRPWMGPSAVVDALEAMSATLPNITGTQAVQLLVAADYVRLHIAAAADRGEPTP